MPDRYVDYDKLQIEHPAEGILKITFNKPERLNSVDSQTHSQLTEIWRDIDTDPTVRAVIVTGAGKAFSGGGDFDLIEEIIDDPQTRMRVWKEARDLVYNIINCNKVIVSAINGPAGGAGRVVGRLAGC